MFQKNDLGNSFMAFMFSQMFFNDLTSRQCNTQYIRNELIELINKNILIKNFSLLKDNTFITSFKIIPKTLSNVNDKYKTIKTNFNIDSILSIKNNIIDYDSLSTLQGTDITAKSLSDTAYNIINIYGNDDNTTLCIEIKPK